MAYELYYWDGIQGRGEFVRLALEEACADYIDITRQPGRGTSAMIDVMESESEPHIPFAPPFLKDGDLIIPHVANILFYLGPKLGLAPEDEGLRHVINGLQLTVTDFVAEVHDTHHPIDTSLYYQDQKPEAKARSAAFIRERIPKFLGYFERVLRQNPKGRNHIVGDALTYAFPKAMANRKAEYPALLALHDAVAKRPNIARYLASPRRLAFNEEGIFRHYPELDGAG